VSGEVVEDLRQEEVEREAPQGLAVRREQVPSEAAQAGQEVKGQVVVGLGVFRLLLVEVGPEVMEGGNEEAVDPDETRPTGAVLARARGKGVD
jgi:hypothetical protein